MINRKGALTGENFGYGAASSSAGANERTAAIAITGVRHVRGRADLFVGNVRARPLGSTCRLTHNRHRSVHQCAGN